METKYLREEFSKYLGFDSKADFSNYQADVTSDGRVFCADITNGSEFPQEDLASVIEAEKLFLKDIGGKIFLLPRGEKPSLFSQLKSAVRLTSQKKGAEPGQKAPRTFKQLNKKESRWGKKRPDF